MLDYGECSEAVHFQFVNPVGIIEWQAPFQERHWLEFKGHQQKYNSIILVSDIDATNFDR